MREYKQHKPLNIALSVLFIIALVILMLTFSIGLPIYCRFFYYIQINTLHLSEEAAKYGIIAGYTEIKTAYDEILNFCTLPNQPFKSGIFAMSEAGAEHFADCKVLFDLNFYGLLFSAIITATLIVLHKLKIITIIRPFGHRAYLLAAIIAVALPVIVGLLCLIAGFDKAFEVFHGIFFPGKDNWTFDPRYDQIITVMPEQFFMNCAILIGVGLVAVSAALIVTDLILTRREKKAER